MKWYWTPLAAIVLLFCFFATTAVMSILYDLDEAPFYHGEKP